MNSASVSCVGPVVAVRVVDVTHLGDERLEHRPERGDAVDRERAHGRAVVGDMAGDRLVAVRRRGGRRRRSRRGRARARPLAARSRFSPRASVVLPGQLPGGLDRLRPARDEEDAVQVARRERRHLGRQLDRLRVGVRPVRVEGQLAHLRERRLADLLAVAVADVDREQPGQRVEVPLPVRVLQVAAVAPHDDGHVVAGAVAPHAGEVHPQVVSRELLQVGACGRHAGRRSLLVWTTACASMIPTATRKMAEPITFTCGGTPRAAWPHT